MNLGFACTGVVCTHSPVNCVGAWSADSCNPACGSRCQPTLTYTITTPRAGAGRDDTCDAANGATTLGAIRTGAACQNGAQGAVTESSGPNGDDEWFAVQPAVGDTIPIGLRTYIGQDQQWGVGQHITFWNGNWGVMTVRQKAIAGHYKTFAECWADTDGDWGSNGKFSCCGDIGAPYPKPADGTGWAFCQEHT
jgi:hypothetical protein